MALQQVNVTSSCKFSYTHGDEQDVAALFTHDPRYISDSKVRGAHIGPT